VIRLLALAVLVASPPAAAATRALIVGNNEGLPDEPPLAYAESDAALVARTLVETQVAPRSEVRVLAGQGLPAVSAALATLGAGAEDTVFLFFSGHGGADGAHLAGQVWPRAEVRARLQAVPARLVVAFFDACRSGVLVGAKGELVRGPPLSLSVEPLGPRGRFLVTSSGASELSYESILLASSPFAVALRSGLRGGADADGDGRVTLAELYGFVYGRTVAATLGAPTGPQHPSQRADLRGAGEVVLVSRLGPARVRRSSAALGPCYFLDPEETRVVAELPAEVDATLALPAGRYAVKCLPGSELRVATVVLGERPLVLESAAFQPAARRYALAKGVDAEPTGSLAAGAGVLSALPGEAVPAVRVGYVLGRGGLGGGPELLLTRRSLLLSATFGAQLPWWRVLGTRLEVGLCGGALFRSSASGATVGPYLQLAHPAGRGLDVTARFELLTLYPWAGDRPSSVLLFSIGVESHGRGAGDLMDQERR
jgi:hypothetical protein